MAKIVFGMNQSLDGYVAGVDGELELLPPPGIALFRYWIDHVHDLAGSLYGRRFARRLKAEVDGVIAVAGPCAPDGPPEAR